MTTEMLAKATDTAEALELTHVSSGTGSPRTSRSRMAGPTS